jgi:hypothetical protein
MVAKEPYLDRDMSPRFLPEVWAWFGIGCLIMALRYAVRLRTVGLRGLQGDDYIMAFVSLEHLFSSCCCADVLERVWSFFYTSDPP